METTENLDLPYLMPSQAQKHVTHNEALRALDALVHLAVLSRNTTAPPELPEAGARHIVPDAATGAWTGEAGKVAAWQDGTWRFYMPRAGWLAHVLDEQVVVVFDGAQWDIAVFEMAVPERLGLATTADAPNRLAVAGEASLFTHEGAGHQIKINKAAAVDTASVLFQTGWSGRAEFGLAGDDDFHVKVSADGAAFTEAMVIDRITGRTRFPAGVDGVREQLAANRTYYVASTGSDVNDGLSPAAPFATLQHAANAALQIDCALHNVTIRLADGSYGGVTVNRPLLGGGTLSIVGNEASPANVVVASTASTNGALVRLSGIKLESPITWTHGVSAENGAHVRLGTVEFGSRGANSHHIRAGYSGRVSLESDYVISGGAVWHIYCFAGGAVEGSNRTVTIVNTPHFPSFLYAELCGVMTLWNPVFSGAIMGRRYAAITNGVINLNGKPTDFLPGTIAGYTANGGVYV